MLKVICILAVVILTCHQSGALPRGKSITDMSQAELLHKFEKFMSNDKEAAAIRQLYEKELAVHRLRKRQAETDGMEGDMNMDEVDPTKAEGFLDRAAKFVLELVQRFLKWINTD